MVRRAVLVMAVVAVGAVRAAPASAHASPDNCKANAIDLTLGKSAGSPSVFRQGDTITFLISIANSNVSLGVPCDVTGATIGFTPPNADGSENQDLNAPSAITVLSNQSYPSMFAARQVASFNWQVRLNPGVEYAFALARVRGTLHDTTQDHTFANVVKDLGFQVTNPVLTLDKIGSITSGQAPQNVTYTYIVRNTSTTPVPMNKVTVSDDKCANPTYVGGDNGDGLLKNGESWTFTCTSLLQAPGTYTNTASACAYSTVPGDTTRPVCSNPDTWTVTLTAPPAPPTPQAGVQGESATHPSRCVTLPQRSLKVRAKELTTVRVHVRLNGKDIARSRVRLSGAGIKRSGRTNRHGMVTFHVRPKKSGRLTIHSDRCAVAARLAVKPARRVVAPALPQVTG